TPLTLGYRATENGDFEGRSVYVAGYPARDPRSDAAIMHSVMGDVYGVKRLQPGEILSVSLETYSVYHDCFTTGGSAGSPLIDLASGLVVGLHHSGKLGLDKEATALWMLKDHPFFTGTGIEWKPWVMGDSDD